MNYNKYKSDWLSSKYTKSEFKARKELAVISMKIQLKRIELGMSQKDFAKKMHVSQGMVSKWESGEYNFTISSLIEIFDKLNIKFELTMEKEKSNTILEFSSIASKWNGNNSFWNKKDDKKLLLEA